MGQSNLEILITFITSLSTLILGVIGAISTAIVKVRKARAKTQIEIKTLRQIIYIMLNSKDFEEAKKLAREELLKLDNEIKMKE